MKKILTICLLILILSNAKAQTIEDYIAEHVDIAQTLMRTHKMPASIILAVAIHESAAGKSKIARYLNNHFGIKGENSNTEIKSAYKDFPSVDSSYHQFVAFLHSRSYFDVLFDKYDQYDFINWAKGIQRAGYAHSRTWASQVIALINKYKLYEYDERPDDYINNVVAVAVVEPAKKRVPTVKKKKTYIVKKGDNLSIIAKRNGTTAAGLMKKNGLSSAALQPGQKLIL